MHELKYAIKHTDQKKTIDVGSQRLRSDGSVDSKRAMQWAGSSVHVMELLENIWCVRHSAAEILYLKILLRTY